MANVGPTKWYVDSVGWTAVTAWNQPQTPAAGTLQRQAAAPTVGNERVFVCIVSGAVGAAEPAWVVTKGAKTTDNAATWQECTGQPGVNGDTANSPTWTQNKNTVVTIGLIIFDSVTSSLQIVSTAGTTGNGAQPSFSATAGTTTADNTVTWTSLGAASNFAAWAAPGARLNAPGSTGVLSVGQGWSVAGDTIFCATEHAETVAGATMTLTAPGSNANPNLIISVNKVVPPTYATGASCTTTAVGPISMNGSFRMQGFTISAGANYTIASNAGDHEYFKDCKFILSTRNNVDVMAVLNNIATNVVWDNTTIKFINIGGSIQCGAGGATSGFDFEWLNTASAIDGTGVIPTNLFIQQQGESNIFIHGVDLSAVNTNLFRAGGDSGGATAKCVMSNSKINAALVVFGTDPASQPADYVAMINCDSAATGFQNQWRGFYGATTTETTITLKNGASDGVQSVSHKYVTNARATVLSPLIWPPPNAKFGVWNTTTGKSVTATVQIISSGTLNNNDIWLEIEFLGSATSSASSFVNSGLANPLSAAVAVTASTATWNSQPATPVTQQLQVSFTPQMVGYVYGRIYIGKTSATIWVDPELTVK